MRCSPNVDVSAELEGNLPTNLQALAGPLAGLSQGFADTAAQKLLARPRVQDTFVELASLSQAQLVKVLHGDTKALSTSDGNVVLDLRPLVLKLGDRFGFVSNLADKVPQDAAQVTILKSDDLETAQKVTHWLEQVANFVWILAVACLGRSDLARPRQAPAGGARARDRPRRRRHPRPARAVARRQRTSSTTSSSARRFGRLRATPGRSSRRRWPAAGWVALSVGVLVAVGAWLVGPGDRATAARAAVAPTLRRPGLAWGSFVVGMVLIVWILPIQMFRTTAILVVASAIGFVVFRRQVAAEAPGPAAAGGRRALRRPTRPRRPTRARLRSRRCRGGAAVAAVAVEHDLVGAHADVEAARGPLERLLEAGIRKRLHLPAVVADQVMVVLPVQVRRLEAGDPVTELDPLHEAELDELLERAIDARDPDAATLAADAVEDLLRRAAARLRAEVLDNGPSRASVAKPFRLEAVERAGAPGRVRLVHRRK